MPENKADREITHLMRREIQAPIVSSLIKGFAREIGHEQALKIARRVIKEDAVLSGKALAARFAGNSITVLSKILKEEWAAKDSMEIDILKDTEKELFFDVTYCGYAAMYEKLGVKELGTTLSCIRDFSFLEGFNPRITLKRNKTIMEGADCCDFRYTHHE